MTDSHPNPFTGSLEGRKVFQTVIAGDCFSSSSLTLGRRDEGAALLHPLERGVVVVAPLAPDGVAHHVDVDGDSQRSCCDRQLARLGVGSTPGEGGGPPAGIQAVGACPSALKETSGFRLECEDVAVEESSSDLQDLLTLLARYHPETFRGLVLSSHYRTVLPLSDSTAADAHDWLAHLYGALGRINRALATADSVPEGGNIVQPAKSHLEGLFSAFHLALCDDFDTPRALAQLTGLAKAANELTKSNKKPTRDVAYTLAACRSALVQAGAALGLLQQDPAGAITDLRDHKAARLRIDKIQIEALIAQRVEARSARDFTRADSIRDELTTLGVDIMDTQRGTDWAVTTTENT